MTPIPAKVLTVDKQSSQCRVLVRIELEKYTGAFHTLRFGAGGPFTGSCHKGQLDLFYYRDPGLKLGSRSLCGLFSEQSGRHGVKILSLYGPDRHGSHLD